MQAANLQESPNHRGDVREARVRGHDHLVRIGSAVASENPSGYAAALARRRKALSDAKRIENLEAQVADLTARLDKLTEYIHAHPKP